MKFTILISRTANAVLEKFETNLREKLKTKEIKITLILRRNEKTYR